MSTSTKTSERWLFLLIWIFVFSANGSARRLDGDGDGIDDEDEYNLAVQFRPYMHYSDDDGCLGPSPEKFVFRLRHPSVGGIPDTDVIAINYVHLYSYDCGANGHSGDNEAALVFLRRSGSEWLFDSVSATAHWNASTCEEWTASTGSNEVWVGKDKHGGYTDLGTCGCTILGVDVEPCDSSGSDRTSVLYNAGEPGDWLFNDLGAVYSSWSGEGIWDDSQFLSAGHIEEQLYISRFMVRTASDEAIACVHQCDEEIACHPPTEECLNERDWCHWDCQGAYPWDSDL